MFRQLADFVFDSSAAATLDLVDAPAPDPDLAARNAARIEAAKKQMGDKYLLARPINAPVHLGRFIPQESQADE